VTAIAFTHRLATGADLPALAALVDAAIAERLKAFLNADQVALSGSIMGIDAQLVVDKTYFVVEERSTGRLAGCGGWSRRAVYGDAHHKVETSHASTAARDAALRAMPADTARIRAMYTHPDFNRRGVGRMILGLCEQAARDAGFGRVELLATLSGEPLYLACGYSEIERFVAASRDGVDVPGVRMGKRIDS
jgi:GNAT superfamily N-acetyltransferase